MRYASAFLIALMFSNPINRPGLLRTGRPVLQLGRSVLLLGSTVFNFMAFRYLQLDEALAILFSTPFLVAILAGPDARRMGRLAALDRDHGRALSACWWWCAPASAACSGRRCSRSAARSATPATASPRACCRRTDTSETTLFYANLFGFVVMVPVLPFVLDAAAVVDRRRC